MSSSIYGAWGVTMWVTPRYVIVSPVPDSDSCVWVSDVKVCSVWILSKLPLWHQNTLTEQRAAQQSSLCRREPPVLAARVAGVACGQQQQLRPGRALAVITEVCSGQGWAGQDRGSLAWTEHYTPQLDRDWREQLQVQRQVGDFYVKWWRKDWLWSFWADSRIRWAFSKP